MKSITCPKCRRQVSEWDVICLNCGCSITPEERERQVKELEKIHFPQNTIHGSTPHPGRLSHQKEEKILKEMNKISFGFFKIGWTELIVPLIITLLLIIVAILMIIPDS